MMTFKTSQALKALRLVFPAMTADMVRRHCELGELEAMRSLAPKRPNYFFTLQAIERFLNRKGVAPEQINKVSHYLLDIGF